MASTYLTRSKSSPTSDKKGTISFWFKRSKITAEQSIIVSGSGSIDSNIYFNGSTDKLHVYDYQSGAFNFEYITTRVFRDTSAWTHLTVEIDTTLSTAADRVKIYINGVRETAFDTSTAPSQNATPLFFTSANPFYIGAYRGSSGYFDGCISHFHYTDGYAYGASTFGSTDSTTGQWQINTSPSVTYGTNGFFILKDGNGVTDQSGQSNNFTVGAGTLTNLQDNPSNVFATWNALKKLTITLSNANTTTLGNGDNGVWGTIGDNQGKWYWETQQNQTSVMMGIIHEGVAQTTGLSGGAGVYGMQEGTTYGYYRNNGSSGQSSGFPNPSNSNVVCHALDLDNGKYFMGINGVFKNLSGTTSNIGTGADPTYSGLDTTKFWFPFTESRGSSCGCDVNFGNGYFGTTAISSAGTNASNLGSFEYDVPAGYTAWCTKGLNE